MAPAPQRVLVISASIGGGHAAAARAVAQALAQSGARVRHVDLLEYTTIPFRQLYRQAYFDLVRTAPDLVDWLGKRLDHAPRDAGRLRLHLRLRARLTRLISYHLPRTIAEYRPDLLVHTHFLSAEVLAAGNPRHLAPQAQVVTDFFAHRLWLQPRIARYFVAAEEVEAHLVSLGVEPSRVRVSGIPVDPHFASLEEQAAARRALHLPPDRDVLLLMAGGMSRGVLGEFLSLARGLRWPLSLVVVCGRSPELEARAREVAGEPDGLVAFRVLGFSNEIPRLMAAADLVAGKPGGLTTSEALAAGRPFAVVDPYPLQEEANANFLLEHGAAMRIDPLTTLELKLGRFFRDAGRRRAMTEAARRLGRPQAALEVAASLLEDPPVAPHRSR